MIETGLHAGLLHFVENFMENCVEENQKNSPRLDSFGVLGRGEVSSIELNVLRLLVGPTFILAGGEKKDRPVTLWLIFSSRT